MTLETKLKLRLKRAICGGSRVPIVIGCVQFHKFKFVYMRSIQWRLMRVFAMVQVSLWSVLFSCSILQLEN